MNMLALFIGQPLGAKVSPLVLPTSRAQIFPQARSVSGRFLAIFYVFCGKSERERGSIFPLGWVVYQWLFSLKYPTIPEELVFVRPKYREYSSRFCRCCPVKVTRPIFF